MSTDPSRRKLLRFAGLALASIPVVLVSHQARATTNPTKRTALKYQDTPFGDKSCATCLAFQAGKTDRAPGKCSTIPGDDEISPNGYCTAWYTL